MPTPSPISDASCVAKSGVSTRWLISVMTPSAHAQGEQRRHQRQAGGDERAEGDQQDDRGGEDADALGRSLGLGEAHHLGAGAAVLDLERAGCGR